MRSFDVVVQLIIRVQIVSQSHFIVLLSVQEGGREGGRERGRVDVNVWRIEHIQALSVLNTTNKVSSIISCIACRSVFRDERDLTREEKISLYCLSLGEAFIELFFNGCSLLFSIVWIGY